jgi:hypothetical protein
MIQMDLYADRPLKSAAAAHAPARTVPAAPGTTGSPAVQRLRETSRSLNARPEVVAQRALGEKLSAAASASQRVGELDAQRSRSAGPSCRVVQRVPITKEAATQMLMKMGLDPKDHEITELWDTEWKSNCHSYTLNQEPDTPFAYPDKMLAGIDEALAMVFVRDGEIWHSGRIDQQGKLNHLLMNIGVLQSTITGAMGYEGCFKLPKQRKALDEYLNLGNKKEARKDHIAWMLRVASRFPMNLPGAEGVLELVLKLGDTTTEVEYNEVKRAFQTFVHKNRKSLKMDGVDDGVEQTIYNNQEFEKFEEKKEDNVSIQNSVEGGEQTEYTDSIPEEIPNSDEEGEIFEEINIQNSVEGMINPKNNDQILEEIEVENQD